MPNFIVHGLLHREGHFAHIRHEIIEAVTGMWPTLSSKIIVGNARDVFNTPDADDAPYVEIRSTESPGTPTLQELAGTITPVCRRYSLNIETTKLAGSYPTSNPSPE